MKSNMPRQARKTNRSQNPRGKARKEKMNPDEQTNMDLRQGGLSFGEERGGY